jgi:DNA-directed RNA polymerase subunit RPC12/RpoP
MAIKFSCGSCGKKFTAKDEHAGRRSKCPACGWGILVPFQTASNDELTPKPVIPPPLLAVAATPAVATAIRTSEDAGAKPTTVRGRRFKIGTLAISGFTGTILLVSAIAVVYSTPRSMPLWHASRPIALASQVLPDQPAARKAPRSAYTFLDVSIGKSLIYEDGKDVFSIRLSRKVSKRTLEEIAREIESDKPRNPRAGTRNRRTVIFCYLPEVDAFGPDGPFGGPWALVDLNGPVELRPNGQQVFIYGFTVDEEIKLVAKQAAPSGKLIGEWIEDTASRSLYFIDQRDGSIYLGHGGEFEQELVGMGQQPFRLFERKERSRAGDYYRINESGDLELRDDNGLIAVARRVP